jgi:hypothetical protein
VGKRIISEELADCWFVQGFPSLRTQNEVEELKWKIDEFFTEKERELKQFKREAMEWYKESVATFKNRK